jgi:alpha/beta superfamily hydrolase
LSFDERAFSFESGGFRIEGALHEGGHALAAVVLHPHPQYGGDMDNGCVAPFALLPMRSTTLRSSQCRSQPG